MPKSQQTPSIHSRNAPDQVAALILLGITDASVSLDTDTLRKISESIEAIGRDWEAEGDLDQAVLNALHHFHKGLQPFLNR